MEPSDKFQTKTEGNAVKTSDLLSFNPLGRPLVPGQVRNEFELMKRVLKKPLTAQIARRICEKSGSHLLKLVSPRVDGDHATLRFDNPESNRRSTVLPSVNAPDIPYCKVVFRPLEVQDGPAMSVIDHILNPNDLSGSVLKHFADVFGKDVLDAMKEVLGSDPKVPRKLGAGEFPIIFVPRLGGGDLQITPVSPATTFMGMKRVIDRYFQKAQPDAPPPLRGRWVKQSISAKPQNISGAIGGPRVRFLATMPKTLNQAEAELHRFVYGGDFPRWRSDGVAARVLQYADRLDAHENYNNQNTRAALDQSADRLIEDSRVFIEDTLDEAKHFANDHGIDQQPALPHPSIPQVLLRRRWLRKGDLDEYDRARKALTSPHFEDRLQKSRLNSEDQT